MASFTDCPICSFVPSAEFEWILVRVTKQQTKPRNSEKKTLTVRSKDSDVNMTLSYINSYYHLRVAKIKRFLTTLSPNVNHKITIFNLLHVNIC